MYGWFGKVLRVNLTTGKISVEDLNPKVARDFIGARGLGAKFLFDEIDPKIDPLSPENKLIFANGPLTGTGAPAPSRHMVVTKAPLTGAIANSNVGGFFPAELKFAGYDVVILEGKSRKPVYLWIRNDKVEIHDASELWGKSTIETEDILQANTEEYAKVACIGPAGENLVKFANIISDKGRAAGRSGVGAVMGSKNLKAVAVRGTKGVTVADRDGFRKATMAAFKAIDTDYTRHFGAYGTPGITTEFMNKAGVYPTRNFQTGVFESADKMSGEKFADTVWRRGAFGSACFGCPVACGRRSKVTYPPEFAGEGEGPEYETIGAFGSVCGVDDIKAISKANFIANEMGFDTITAGDTIGCAMELCERGFLPAKDVGMELSFGNARAMVELVGKIAHREGFGDILAEGSYLMAEKYGHPELSMSCKKQECPMYDPRGTKALAIQYATESRGGDHIRGSPQDIDLFGCYHLRLTKDRGITYEDGLFPKHAPLLAKESQDWISCVDSSGICSFMFYLGEDEDNLLALLETATGASYGGIKGMMKTGERIFNLERLFNLKAGLTAKDDTIPERFLKEPMPEGPAKGHIVELDKMLPEYYKLRKWTEEGIPTAEKLKELRLA